MLDSKDESRRELETHNRALVQKAFNAWKAGSGTPYDLLAENMTWTIVGQAVVPRVYTTKAAFIDTVMRPFAARLQGPLTPTVHAIYAEGTSVAIHADVDGTAKDGKPYHNSYAWFFEMKEDKVTRVVAFVDIATFNELFERVTPA